MLIYEFVHNHIDYVPYFGALKGAVLTLTERAGNDFDQAALMVALLRASGITAQLVYGDLLIPVLGSADHHDLQHWLGVDGNTTVIGRVLAGGGIPFNQSGATWEVTRVWVKATIGGVAYLFDPAFKVYEETPGIDLAAAMGYARAALLAAAGGTVGSDYVQNLDEAGLRGTLADLSTTLIGYLRANDPTASMEEIIGGRAIVPEHLLALPTSLPFATSGTPQVWDAVPDAYLHKVQIQLGGINLTRPIPEIAGKKLAVDFVGGGAGQLIKNVPQPPDALEFQPVFVGGGSDIHFNLTGDSTYYMEREAYITNDTSSAFSITAGAGQQYFTPSSPVETVPVTVHFDGIGQSTGLKTATLNRDTYFWVPFGGYWQGPYQVTQQLVGVVAPRARLWLDDELLTQEPTPGSWSDLWTLRLTIDHPYVANGGTFHDQVSTYNIVRGGTYVIVSDFGASNGGELLKQRNAMLDGYRASGTPRDVLTEALNVIGQAWMRQTCLADRLMAELEGVLYVDHHRFGLVGQEGGFLIDIKTYVSSGYSRHSDASGGSIWFKGTGFLRSAMEHGVLEQLQGVDKPAVSTVKLIRLANSLGQKIFLVNDANFSTIKPQLTGYSAEDLTTIGNLVVSDPDTHTGTTFILPANGQIVVDQWRGMGYISLSQVAGGIGKLRMVIGGDYFGGHSGTPTPLDVALVASNPVFDPADPVERLDPESQEPIDLATGAYVYRHTDLALGVAGPEGLAFGRYYNSDDRHRQSALGRGWTHAYDIVAKGYSNGAMALGMRQPVDAAALLVASTVSLDLMRPISPGVKNWAIGALTANWAMDQLLDNAVSIRVQGKTFSYLRLPDGSYSPPPGITTDLVKAGGLYELRERFGTVLAFNGANQLATWTDEDGNRLTLSYSGGKVATVTDAVGRHLTLTYTGAHLTRVTDSTGRFVSYGYDSTGNLTTYTDPSGHVWRYGYDPDHRLTTVTDPLGVTLASNHYDSLGRVDTQTVPRQGGVGVTYRYYFSGPRTVEEDPYGGRTIYYFDRKGRTVSVEDALGNRTFTAYDGQNHPVAVTNPRGATTTSVYDAHQNVTRVTDALGHVVTNAYDAQNHLTATADPLGHTTRFVYDGEHHLIQTADPLGHATRATYDTHGRAASITDSRGTRATLTYDTFGNPNTTKVGAHPVVDEAYDAIGRRTALTDPVGVATTFTYDPQGLLLSRTDPLGQSTSQTYDAAGRLLTSTDRRGFTVSYTYTASGKVDTITYASGTPVHFTYDLRDNVISMVDRVGTTTYTYDAANRLTSQIDPHGFTVGYGYDAAGNITTLTYPGNKPVTYTYDALNRLATVTDWLGRTATYTYDAAGRLIQLTKRQRHRDHLRLRQREPSHLVGEPHLQWHRVGELQLHPRRERQPGDGEPGGAPGAVGATDGDGGLCLQRPAQPAGHCRGGELQL